MHNAPMKRNLLLPLVLASVALTGCQTIKAHNPFRHREPAYTAAQQARPLEVPPGMDAPSTADALVIPDASPTAPTANAQPAAAQPEMGAAGATGVAPGATSNSLTLADTPDNAYRRVGLALSRGDVGQVTAHDDAAHTYEVAVDSVVTEKPEGGFVHRLFHRTHQSTVKGTVTVSVAPAATGSVVSAEGNPDAVARVIGLLQQRLQ